MLRAFDSRFVFPTFEQVSWGGVLVLWHLSRVGGSCLQAGINWPEPDHIFWLVMLSEQIFEQAQLAVKSLQLGRNVQTLRQDPIARGVEERVVARARRRHITQTPRLLLYFVQLLHTVT